MSSTCRWKYSLLELTLQCQWFSYCYYTWQREDIHAVFIWKTMQLTRLWKVMHLQLCSLYFLQVWNRSGTIPIENRCDTTTDSTTSAAIFTPRAIKNASNTYTVTYNSDRTINANVLFWFSIIGSTGIGWFSGWMPQT